MHKYILLLVMVLSIFLLVGCITTDNSASPKQVASAASDAIFRTALTTATNILAKGGTKELALVSAKSVAACYLSDAEMRKIADAILTDAVAQIIEHMAENKTVVVISDPDPCIYSAFLTTQAFKDIVLEAAARFRYEIR